MSGLDDALRRAGVEPAAGAVDERKAAYARELFEVYRAGVDDCLPGWGSLSENERRGWHRCAVFAMAGGAR